MKTVVRYNSMSFLVKRERGTRYLRDRKLSDLIKRCRVLEKEGFDYLFPIKKVLETARHEKDGGIYAFGEFDVFEYDRGFYYEVVMRRGSQ